RGTGAQADGTENRPDPIGRSGEGDHRVGGETAGDGGGKRSGIARPSAVFNRTESRPADGRTATLWHARPTGSHGKTKRRPGRCRNTSKRCPERQRARSRPAVCPQAARGEVCRDHVRTAGQTI